MRKSIMMLMIVFSILAFMSGAAFAGPAEKPLKMEKATTMMEGMGKDKSMMEGASKAVFDSPQRLSKIIGSEVINNEGVQLGRVDDLIADENGRISYLVLARGGLMGIGTKLVAVPVSEAPPRITTDGKCLINVDLATLDKAPTFTVASFPNFSDRSWQEESRGYFGDSDTKAPAGEVKKPAEHKMDPY